MTENPPQSSGERQFVSCPFCTIQIASDETVCPHCRQPLPAQEKPKPSPAPQRRIEIGEAPKFGPASGGLVALWDRYGKWVKVAGPVLAAILLLLLVYGMWVGAKVTIVPNPSLPIKVKKEKSGSNVLFTVMVTNMGEDVPDLSLKSIGVVVETVYKSGRREKKTFFPKGEFLGEGALLREETGSFDLVVPAKDLKEVVLRSEVVDLGLGRTLITPGAGAGFPAR